MTLITLAQIEEQLLDLFKSKRCPRSKIAPKKSEMCESWLAGEACSFHPKCHYAHGMKEIYPRTFDKTIYKVRSCTNTNGCRYKTRCCYCHDDIAYIINDKLKVLHSMKESVYRVVVDSTPTTVSVLTFHQVEPLNRDLMTLKYTKLFCILKTLVSGIRAEKLNEKIRSQQSRLYNTKLTYNNISSNQTSINNNNTNNVNNINNTNNIMNHHQPIQNNITSLPSTPHQQTNFLHQHRNTNHQIIHNINGAVMNVQPTYGNTNNTNNPNYVPLQMVTTEIRNIQENLENLQRACANQLNQLQNALKQQQTLQSGVPCPPMNNHHNISKPNNLLWQNLNINTQSQQHQHTSIYQNHINFTPNSLTPGNVSCYDLPSLNMNSLPVDDRIIGNENILDQKNSTLHDNKLHHSGTDSPNVEKIMNNITNIPPIGRLSKFCDDKTKLSPSINCIHDDKTLTCAGVIGDQGVDSILMGIRRF